MKSKKPLLARNSLKNFQFEGEKIIKKEDARPTELKAIIYCRVSGERQVKEGFGLETQEMLCRERCKNHSPAIEVIKVFREEAVSGNKPSRSAFEEAVSFLKDQNDKYSKITHFICRELSRISRPDLDDIGVAFDLEKSIKQYGVEIIDILGGIKDDTDEGQLMKVIQYAFAGYERNMIKKKCQNGKRARLLEWYRPFCEVPLGYKREKLGNKWYSDEIDRDVANILKSGLEIFASDPTMGQAELHKYLIDKWLSKVTGKKIWKSYLEKMFQLHRLYYYAGYIIYPALWINELIEWKHTGFIDLSTAEMIRKKLQKGGKGSRKQKESDEFLLKGLITCRGCGRKLTWWTTTKSNGKKYSYYGCQCEKCPELACVPKDSLEQLIIDVISSMQLSEELLNVFDLVLDRTSTIKWKDWESEVKLIEARIKYIQKEKEGIEQYLTSGKWNVKLQETMENKRGELETEEQELVNQVQNKDKITQERIDKIKKIKDLLKSPLLFRELGDRSLRKLLIAVRFWDGLEYSKSNWLQTAETSTLYSILRHLNEKVPASAEEGTRTLKPYGIRTSSVHVYQFHHLSTFFSALQYIQISIQKSTRFSLFSKNMIFPTEKRNIFKSLRGLSAFFNLCQEICIFFSFRL